MKKGWEKDNIEKSKKVLEDHFKRKKEEEMFKEMLREGNHFSIRPQFHLSTIDWDTDDSDFDEINDDSIWEDLTASDNKKERGSE
ncbi:hypothetical protein LCGC14_1020110 [marine sediment metagenome]|uniref:Uncharacterized protein n=1 Tax=marine sediment metagenome TaxID=412755 RepID=A0A0F9NJ93_9ZZZZ